MSFKIKDLRQAHFSPQINTKQMITSPIQVIQTKQKIIFRLDSGTTTQMRAIWT